jgi:hypothetical protein
LSLAPNWRAHAIGLALFAFVGFAAIHNLMVIRGSYTAIGFSAAVFLLFLCAFPLNVIASRPIETAQRDLTILRGWLKDMGDG